ncbi:MAG: aminopeptidase N [Rhizobiaceae bacterium]|nr:aminopeptidase N [Rhizobiaceae bacterium]
MRADSGNIIRLKNYKIADYKVIHADLLFKLDPTATIVKSVLKVERSKGVKPGSALLFDGEDLVLKQICIGGKELNNDQYSISPQQLKIQTPPKSEQFTLEIEVEINPQANTQLMGLYRSSGKYCTQCEAEGFRRITFYPDRPDVLTTFTTRIEADRDEMPVLLGNGNLKNKGRLSGNRHYAEWDDPHPKPSYLFALVAGDLGSAHKNFKTMSGKKVKLGIYVERGKEPQTAYAMDALVRSMKWDEEVFGCEYDLDVFNIVAVSDFNMGAMENKGLNVFNDKYVLADVNTATDVDYANIEAIIAHEYFHNWTGNRITCRDWFQLCLKEGLTVYRDQEFSSDMRSRPVVRIADVRNLRTSQFAEDAGPLAHPVRPQTYREINNFYTATVYQKGAELVRMLATILGPKHFKKGMGLYLRRHDGDAATIEDFLKCFADASKRNLDQFALWYSQAGTPSVIASSNYDSRRKKLTLELEQILSPTSGQARKKLLHIPLRAGLVAGNGTDIQAINITGCEHDGDLLHLTKRKHKVIFHGVDQRAAVSLNRNFSAPVNLEIHQTNTDLAFLAINDSDPFNRWQAFQSYAQKLLISGARALGRGKAPKIDNRFLDCAFAIVMDRNLSAEFRALTLTLPGESELARIIGRSVNPDAIHNARNALIGEIGKRVVEGWDELWQETQISEPYQSDAEQSGKRGLRNLLLNVGLAANHKQSELASIKQFSNATNMDERYAAFCRIVLRHHSRKASDRVIEEFYNKYKTNALVLDKWFATQAMVPGRGAIKSVRALMRHKKFTLNNPNRARSVLASFAFGNPTGFNATSGEGYQLVSGVIEKIDIINPQIAARLLTAFGSIGSLEPKRQKKAVDALRKLQKNKKLSTDVSEILDRTLSG